MLPKSDRAVPLLARGAFLHHGSSGLGALRFMVFFNEPLSSCSQTEYLVGEAFAFTYFLWMSFQVAGWREWGFRAMHPRVVPSVCLRPHWVFSSICTFAVMSLEVGLL